MRKRIFTLLFILVFITVIFPGCSGAKKTGGDKNKINNTTNSSKHANTKEAMGRYMESKVELPKLTNNERVIDIIQNADNQIELYTVVKLNYYSYKLHTDMTWEKGEPGWLNDKTLKLKLTDNVLDICLGEDGSYYAVYVNYNDMKYHIIKSEDQVSGKPVELPYLKETTHDGRNGEKFGPMIDKLRVLANKNLVLFDQWEDGSLLTFSSKGEKLDTIPIGMDYNFTVSGNKIIVENEENKGFKIYNTGSKAIDRTVEYDVSKNGMAIALKEDGSLFLGDSKGIHRLSENGTLWETIIDGALNSMSMPSLRFDSLYVMDGMQDEYYAVYSDNDSGYQLMHYAFDKKVSSVPEKEITVYSLRENSTIRQAISMYQSKNSNVKVSYIVAMENETGKPADYIRALNTEILNGNGADILVLDGLPVASYIEKGVLKDISKIINPMEQSGELLSNITKSFYDGKKIYRIPIRFSIPMIEGKKEAVAVAVSTKGIADLLKNTQEPYTMMTKRQLLRDYLALYSDEFIKNDKIDMDDFNTFLKNLKVIAENVKGDETTDVNSNLNDIDNDLFIGNELALKDNYASALSQIKNVTDSIFLFSMLKEGRFVYDSINQKFLPIGMVGINNASKESVISQDFLKFLFSKEVQNVNLYDGFPVNVSSLERWISEEHPDYSYAISDHSGHRITAFWPQKKNRDSLLAIAKKLNRPIEINQTVNDMLIEEILPYLNGTKDINEVSSAVKMKVNTYLAE